MTISEPQTQVQGTVAPGYEAVRDLFAQNFERNDDYRESGAAIAAYDKGRLVVDLWAGYADRARTRPWQGDTLVNLYSATKGIVTITAAMMYENGAMLPTQKVTEYWPEYGAQGKHDTVVSDLFQHMAGLPGFREPTVVTDLYEWQQCCDKLARQKPSWPPGEVVSYHTVTWGFLVGEVMRRANGTAETIGRIIDRMVAKPYRADFFLGTPESEDHRVAEILLPRAKWWDKPVLWRTLARLMPRFMGLCNPSVPADIPTTDPRWRRAEIPAANGHASARALARIYGAFAYGRLEDCPDTQRMPPAAIINELMFADQFKRDRMFGTRDGRTGGLDAIGWNRRGVLTTVGHHGWGGCLGVANTEKCVGIGYVTSQMPYDHAKDSRAKNLCAAILAASGAEFVESPRRR